MAAGLPSAPPPRIARPRWGRRTTLFQWRNPAFWLFALVMVGTGFVAVGAQAVFRDISPSGWMLSWALLALYALPVFIVVLVAAAALLLKPEHIEARVGLSITALLTLVALQFSAQAGLPDVGYLLMLDQIYLASYGFVLLVVGLLVMTTGNAEDEKELAAAHSLASEQADERSMPLAGVGAVLGQGAVEIALHVGVSAVGEEGREIGVHLLGVELEVELEADHDPPRGGSLADERRASRLQLHKESGWRTPRA